MTVADETHHWSFTYEGNKVIMIGIITTPDKVYNYVKENYFDNAGNLIADTYIYEDYCDVSRTYDYSEPDQFIHTLKLYSNYPNCELDDIQVTTYFLNEDKTFNSSLHESSMSTSSRTYRYETEDGNIVAMYNTTSSPESLQGTYTYDLTKEVPENMTLLNGLISADPNWKGKNLMIEQGHLEGTNTYYIKNEFEFDSHGNITKIYRYRSYDDNQHYHPLYNVTISYEPI